jgi:hypothetical protein
MKRYPGGTSSPEGIPECGVARLGAQLRENICRDVNIIITL